MAFTGGGGTGPKPFSPFTMTANQAGQQQSPGAGSFTFGSGALNTSTGFTFGTGTSAPSAAATSTPQLSFTAATPAATTSSLFSFGASVPPAASTAGAFGFGTPAASPAQPSSLTTPASQGLSFGTPATVSASVVPQASTATVPVSFTSTPPTAANNAVQPTFGVPATTQAAASTLVTPVTTVAAAPTTAPLSGFAFGTGSAPVNLANPIRPTTTTAAVTSTSGATGGGDAASASTTVATTTTQSNTTVSQMNFRQLQEAINKWMLDLQEQEKLFLDQATKVNAWDKTLISNGDKIAKLNESITKVKNDHTRLEHALDYLKTQQQEFEGFLEPLETGLPVNIPVEPEREHLYSVTESVDTQLQQMAEDLKEVIRHINESNKTVDKNDPISQILRILNEHTDALQWVEDNANQVRRSLEGVSKQHQMAKKEHERTLRQMFK